MPKTDPTICPSKICFFSHIPVFINGTYTIPNTKAQNFSAAILRKRSTLLNEYFGHLQAFCVVVVMRTEGCLYCVVIGARGPTSSGEQAAVFHKFSHFLSEF